MDQTKAVQSRKGGDWTTVLSSPVLLNQNDTLQVSNVFLDTRASFPSARLPISFGEDIPIAISFMPCLTEFMDFGNTHDDMVMPFPMSQFTTYDIGGDATIHHHRFQCEGFRDIAVLVMRLPSKQILLNHAETPVEFSVKVDVIKNFPVSEYGEHLGDTCLKASFVVPFVLDTTWGNLEVGSYPARPLAPYDKPFTPDYIILDDNPDDQCDVNIFSIDYNFFQLPFQRELSNYVLNQFKSGISYPTLANTTPYIVTLFYNIPKGEYSSASLAEEMSAAFQNVRPEYFIHEGQQQLFNPIYANKGQTGSLMFWNGVARWGAKWGTETRRVQTYLATWKNRTDYAELDKRLMGAIDLNIAFNSDAQRFELRRAHIPFYDASGNPSVVWGAYPGLPALWKGAQSYMVVTGLHPGRIWQDLLRIENAPRESVFQGRTNEDYHFSNFPWYEATTHPVFPTAAVVPKVTQSENIVAPNAASNVHDDQILQPMNFANSQPPFPNPRRWKDMHRYAVNTETVIAGLHYKLPEDPPASFSHFVLTLEGSFGVGATVVSEEHHDATIYQSVIGTYYQQGGFTSSEGDLATITYTGRPTLLSSIRCRITTSSRDPEHHMFFSNDEVEAKPFELGTMNTLYLVIVHDTN